MIRLPQDKSLLAQIALLVIALLVVIFVMVFRPQPRTVPTTFRIALDGQTITINQEGRRVEGRDKPAISDELPVENDEPSP